LRNDSLKANGKIMVIKDQQFDEVNVDIPRTDHLTKTQKIELKDEIDQ